jgi:uncharacterized protein (DUF2336 family)
MLVGASGEVRLAPGSGSGPMFAEISSFAMIVRRFLAWAETAPAASRAQGAGALARAFLTADLVPSDRREAERALTRLLDDPSPLVRRALAESFASAGDAPRHIVVVLANDQSDVAAPILSLSPLLNDAELIDCAAIGDAFAQAAIALRPRLSAAVAAALAEMGAREALISLAVNPGADLPEFSARRMLERFGEDGEMREALLSRPHLSAALRADLVAATARALSTFVTACAWMSEARAARVTREAREKATIIIAADAREEGGNGPLKLVAHLRASGQLTAGLVLRALLSGNRSLFEAALGELSGMPLARVTGLVRAWHSAGFVALYAKARLPAALLPAFQAALAAQDEIGACLEKGSGECLSRAMIERVLTACESLNPAETGKLTALLRRFEAEAACEEARELAAERPASAPAHHEIFIDLAAIEAELLQAA